MKRWLKYAGLLALAGATLLIAGCPTKGRPNPEGTEGVVSPTPPPPAPAPGITPVTTLAPVTPTQVKVSVTDTAVTVTPAKVPSGPVVITFTNTGKALANVSYTIDGKKTMKAVAPKIPTMESLSLKAGSISFTVAAAGGKSLTGTLTVTSAKPVPKATPKATPKPTTTEPKATAPKAGAPTTPPTTAVPPAPK